MKNNSYMKILRENKIEILEDGFPIFKKSKKHETIVKFTSPRSGSIVKESHMRTNNHRDDHGSLGKLGYTTDRWCEYDDNNWWTNLTHEESMQFDSNYKKIEKEKITTKQKLEAMSFLLSAATSDNKFDNEIIDALVDIAGLGNTQ